jgi:hypothetical protein
MASSPDPAALLDRLADAYWSTAARHGWRLYQERGRGAIVFTIREEDDGRREPMKYLTFNDHEEARDGSFAKLYDLVTTYDPTQQIVLAAVLPDGRTVFDTYGRAPAPPVADANGADSSEDASEDAPEGTA